MQIIISTTPDNINTLVVVPITNTVLSLPVVVPTVLSLPVVVPITNTVVSLPVVLLLPMVLRPMTNIEMYFISSKIKVTQGSKFTSSEGVNHYLVLSS